jgi:hypothetical protein
MVDLFLGFWGIYVLFSIVAVLIYISQFGEKASSINGAENQFSHAEYWNWTISHSTQKSIQNTSETNMYFLKLEENIEEIL